MDPTELFLIVIWNGNRYPVHRRFRNIIYFKIGSDDFVKVIQETGYSPTQLVVDRIEKSQIPENEKIIRLTAQRG